MYSWVLSIDVYKGSRTLAYALIALYQYLIPCVKVLWAENVDQPHKYWIYVCKGIPLLKFLNKGPLN